MAMTRSAPRDATDPLGALRWRIAANAGRGRRCAPRWTHVRAATAFGSGRSIQLCRDAGFDPDEMVGDADDAGALADIDVSRNAERILSDIMDAIGTLDCGNCGQIFESLEILHSQEWEKEELRARMRNVIADGLIRARSDAAHAGYDGPLGPFFVDIDDEGQARRNDLSFPSAKPPLADPRLRRLEHWLDVIVLEPASSVLWCGSRDFARAKDDSGDVFESRLIDFPVGTTVWYEPGDRGDDTLFDRDWERTWPSGVVSGYCVKAQEEMDWQTVSPRCCRCGKPTGYDEQVTVELVTTEHEYATMRSFAWPAPGQFGVVCQKCEGTAR